MRYDIYIYIYINVVRQLRVNKPLLLYLVGVYIIHVLYNNARKDIHVILSLILKFYGPIHLTSFKKTGLQLCYITTTNSPSPRQDNSSRLYKTAITYSCSQNSAVDLHAEVTDYISCLQTLFL